MIPKATAELACEPNAVSGFTIRTLAAAAASAPRRVSFDIRILLSSVILSDQRFPQHLDGHLAGGGSAARQRSRGIFSSILCEYMKLASEYSGRGGCA
jgi:hypothetical protein